VNISSGTQPKDGGIQDRSCKVQVTKGKVQEASSFLKNGYNCSFPLSGTLHYTVHPIFKFWTYLALRLNKRAGLNILCSQTAPICKLSQNQLAQTGTHIVFIILLDDVISKICYYSNFSKNGF